MGDNDKESTHPFLTVTSSDSIQMLKCAYICGFKTMKPLSLFDLFRKVCDIQNNKVGDVIVTERQFWNALQPLLPEEIPMKVDALLSSIFHSCTSKMGADIKWAASLVELLCILNIFCGGSKSQKLAFMFSIFDGDQDGDLQEDEFLFMLSTILKGICLVTGCGQNQDPEELSSWMQMTSEVILQVCELSNTVSLFVCSSSSLQ